MGWRIMPILLSGILLVAPCHAQNDVFARARELSQAFSRAAAAVIPSVVNVSTTAVIPGRRPPIADFFPLPPELLEMLSEPPQLVHSLGSGVIFRSDGYVVTNAHVVSRAQHIQVGLADERTAEARIVGADPATDLAVLRVPLTGLPAARWGDADKLQVGEWVLAIGSPHGLKHSVTAGIISAKGRTQTAISGYEDFIQTDAAINPGNSGGALANLSGEVIGINTAIVSRTGGYEGIGFAIPSNTAVKICHLLMTRGEVVRGYLGIVPAPVTRRAAAALGMTRVRGVMVRAIYRDSPAEKAGILPGDIITQFSGQRIDTVPRLARLVADTPVGRQVSVVLWRRAQRLTVAVVIGKRPAELAGELWFGI